MDVKINLRKKSVWFNHFKGQWSYGWTSIGRFETFTDLDLAKDGFLIYYILIGSSASKWEDPLLKTDC